MRALTKAFLTLASGLLLITVSGRADTFNINASERGWVCSPSASCNSAGGAGNNGALPGNNYFAGFFSFTSGQFRDWFEFSIPTLTGGTLVSATLQHNPGHHAGRGCSRGH
jgi:hypothetical protein